MCAYEDSATNQWGDEEVIRQWILSASYNFPPVVVTVACVLEILSPLDLKENLLIFFYFSSWRFEKRVCMHSLLSINRRVLQTHNDLRADGRHCSTGRRGTFFNVFVFLRECSAFVVQACLGWAHLHSRWPRGIFFNKKKTSIVQPKKGLLMAEPTREYL